jgi:hypothetical protein
VSSVFGRPVRIAVSSEMVEHGFAQTYAANF